MVVIKSIITRAEQIRPAQAPVVMAVMVATRASLLLQALLAAALLRASSRRRDRILPPFLRGGLLVFLCRLELVVSLLGLAFLLLLVVVVDPVLACLPPSLRML